MTQAELAAEVQVTPRTIGRWERGEVVPPLLVLGPLCDSLGLPAEYFRRAPAGDVDRMLLESHDRRE